MRWPILVFACAGSVLGQSLTKEDQEFLDLLGPVPPLVTEPPVTEPPVTDYKTCGGPNQFCVPYYQCEDGVIVSDGAGLIDIRFGSKNKNTETQVNQHSLCNSTYTEVCCIDPDVPVPTAVPVDPTPPPTYQPTCGRRNFLGVNARIVGIPDTESQFGEFPWMAAVLRSEGDRLVFVCGASLISPNVLATAAHCVYNDKAGSLVVRLGEWDTQHTTEFYKHVDINVIKITIHEAYNHARQNLHNDIALLTLLEPAPLQEHIDTICLPEKNSPPLVGAKCIATGWGKNSFNDGEYQLVLKQVSLPLVYRDRCQNYLRKTRLGRRFSLHHSFVCAGGESGADTCTGDGGSPLACPDPNNPERYVLGGIVSWGIGCGTANVPGVYVDVHYFIDWIYSNL